MKSYMLKAGGSRKKNWSMAGMVVCPLLAAWLLVDTVHPGFLSGTAHARTQDRASVRMPVTGLHIWPVVHQDANVLGAGRSHPSKNRDSGNTLSGERRHLRIVRQEAVPLLPLDGLNPPELVGFQDVPDCEIFDLQGRPLRLGCGVPQTLVPSRKKQKRVAMPPKISLDKLMSRPVKGVGRTGPVLAYQGLVKQYAGYFRMKSALLLAIIHAESLGNPNTVSRAQATGLMQVQPHTAGKEVEDYLRRKGIKPVPGELSSPERNIQFGAAYLHLLENRWFRKVLDPMARQFCVIAAYNAGPGRFLRHFGKTPSDAVLSINRFSAQDLYTEITGRIPQAETRRYLEKVFYLLHLYTKMGY